MITRFPLVRLLFALALLFVLALPASACVGKTLVIGSAGTLQQDLLAQMLNLLISERTGTTVKVVRYDSATQAHDALMDADLDILVEYTGIAQVTVLKGEGLGDAEALFKAVKDGYNQKYNLIWLTPFGFDEASLAPAESIPAQAAPVVRKDTLKKFPALARLIKKLGGAVSGEAMATLEKEAQGGDIQGVARRFLKNGRYI
mgnify:CR=1 FL=1